MCNCSMATLIHVVLQGAVLKAYAICIFVSLVMKGKQTNKAKQRTEQLSSVTVYFIRLLP